MHDLKLEGRGGVRQALTYILPQINAELSLDSRLLNGRLAINQLNLGYCSPVPVPFTNMKPLRSTSTNAMWPRLPSFRLRLIAS